MPDHAHLIIQVNQGDLRQRHPRHQIAFDQDLVQNSGRGSLWQRSFIDRSLWTAQDYERAIDYVLTNPVKAGIVSD